MPDDTYSDYDCSDAAATGAEIGGYLGYVAGGSAAILSGSAGVSNPVTVAQGLQALGNVALAAEVGEVGGGIVGEAAGYVGCEVGNSVYDMYQSASDYINGSETHSEPDMSSPVNDGYLV
jgi:hypothetical protein